MYEIFKEFTFEAAHHLAVNVADGHPYARLHGHSFKVEVFLKGEKDKDKNWLCDFGEIERQIVELRRELDHNLPQRYRWPGGADAREHQPMDLGPAAR